jgi:predicted DsbA family dithiol-disulfide isomerase
MGAGFGVSGTPTFAINGVKLAGAAPLEEFRSYLDRALATAKASGIPRAEYYDRAVLGR